MISETIGDHDFPLMHDDEAHNFEPKWLALAAKMVNPDTKALMSVYDDAQAIYRGRKHQKITKNGDGFISSRQEEANGSASNIPHKKARHRRAFF